jgi:hypothetical protein
VARFKGGAKLTAALRELAEKVTKPGTLRVGFLEGATYLDTTPVAMIAAIQNWGAPKANIPPRPFFSNMVRDKSPGWGKAVETNLKDTGYDATVALKRVGKGIAGQLRQSILDTTTPPLKPATVRRKGFDKPLEDTGHMLNRVNFEVKGD